MKILNITDYIQNLMSSALAKFSKLKPWEITTNASSIVEELIELIKNNAEYTINNNICLHKSAII